MNGTDLVSVAPGGQAYTGPLDVRQLKRTRLGQRGVAVWLEDDESMGDRLQTL